MKAIVCKEFGPPEKLVLEDIEEPKAGEGQVVIESQASTVTFPGCADGGGQVSVQGGRLPSCPGGEAAGRGRARSGAGVEVDSQMGDRVVGGKRSRSAASQETVVAARAEGDAQAS